MRQGNKSLELKRVSESGNKPVLQSCAVAKSENSGGPLDNQTWQTAWKTAPLAKVQLCEYENQTLEAFVAASYSYVKYDCPVAQQNSSLLATAHDCETGLPYFLE